MKYIPASEVEALQHFVEDLSGTWTFRADILPRLRALLASAVELPEPVEVKPFVDSKDERTFKGDGIEYIRRRARKHEINYGDLKQAAHLRSLADDLERRLSGPVPDDKLREAAEAVLEVLEIGTDLGLHHMSDLGQRCEWLDRMKPRREALRAALRKEGA